jgi:hypothetical protein
VEAFDMEDVVFGNNAVRQGGMSRNRLIPA